MGLTSLQVCMDTSEWLQGTIHEDGGMDSSPSSGGGGDMITCSRPLLERRLRPQHDQALKCPRCDSAHTKFCYYNNYSLSQPRYFCKTCRRYWTKGGSLRNIPVGGGCRKNKRVTSKKSSSSSSTNDHHPINPNLSSSNNNINDTTTTDLHLSFPHEAVQMPHFTSLFGNSGEFGGLTLMESKYNAILDQNPPRHDHQVADFLESSSSKYDHNSLITGNPTNHDFMGNSTDLGLVGGLGLGDVSHHQSGFTTTTTTPSNYHGFCTSSLFGNISLNGNNNHHDSLMMNTTQRLMLPFEAHDQAAEGPNHAIFEMKPNKQQLLSQLDHHQWSHQQQGGHHDQAGCNEVGKDSFGYFSSNSTLGSWTGMMNGAYGSSHQTNPLV